MEMLFIDSFSSWLRLFDSFLPQHFHTDCVARPKGRDSGALTPDLLFRDHWLTDHSTPERQELAFLRESSYDAEARSKPRGPIAEQTLDMVEHDGLMRVFWPTDALQSDRSGVIVGWRNSVLDVFVVAVLDDVDVSSLLLGRHGKPR